jgi:hypothetical protein
MESATSDRTNSTLAMNRAGVGTRLSRNILNLRQWAAAVERTRQCRVRLTRNPKKSSADFAVLLAPKCLASCGGKAAPSQLAGASPYAPHGASDR